MNLLNKEKSLGIVLTERYAEAVLVKTGGRFRGSVRGGRIAIPEGLIRGGEIESPPEAAAILKKLLRREKISVRRATVCLPEKAVLLQIMDLPQEIPSTLHKSIRSEIRHSPLLTGRSPVYDFTSLGTDESGLQRLLIGATDSECICGLLQTLRLAGLEAQSIEIDFLAALRAYRKECGFEIPSDHFLFGSTQGRALTLCGFLKGRPDFIQRTQLPDDRSQLREFILSGFQNLRRYYEIEKGLRFSEDRAGILLLDEETVEPDSWRKEFVSAFGSGFDLRVFASCRKGCEADGGLSSPISFGGLGLALKPFEKTAQFGSPEFLPSQEQEIRDWKRTGRLAAVGAVSGLLLMYGISQVMGYHVLRSARAAEGSSVQGRTQSLVEERNRIGRLLKQVRAENEMRQHLSAKDRGIGYASLLGIVHRRIPQDTQVTSLEIRRSGHYVLTGRTVLYENIDRFCRALESTEEIQSAEVSESRRSADLPNLHEFEILCTLNPGREETGR